MQTEAVKLYWQPGCSSCVKIKEMFEELGVPFQSKNILAEPAAMDDLIAIGVRTVPVVMRGKDYVFGQSLDDVARFVGRADSGIKRLPPDELARRWLTLLEGARDYIDRVPDDRMEHRPVPNRDRSMRALISHIFQIPDGFLQVVQDGLDDIRVVTNARYDHLRSKADLKRYADDVINRLRAWWDALPAEERACTRQMKTFYGPQPLHQMLERGTWHSGQHVRQLVHVVDELGNGIPDRVPPAVYAGLPLPRGMWD